MMIPSCRWGNGSWERGGDSLGQGLVVGECFLDPQQGCPSQRGFLMVAGHPSSWLLGFSLEAHIPLWKEASAC